MNLSDRLEELENYTMRMSGEKIAYHKDAPSPASKKQTASNILNDLLELLPTDEIVNTKYGYISNEKKYGFRMAIAELRQRITEYCGEQSGGDKNHD